MSKITRTIEIADINPSELADVFCGMWANEQAEFFDAIKAISASWPGAGWCQQSCSIAADIGPAGREVITKLAEHVLDYDELLNAASRVLRVFDDLKATTTAERIIVGKSDSELRKQASEAMDELRAAVAKSEGMA